MVDINNRVYVNHINQKMINQPASACGAKLHFEAPYVSSVLCSGNGAVLMHGPNWDDLCPLCVRAQIQQTPTRLPFGEALKSLPKLTFCPGPIAFSNCVLDLGTDD